MIKSCFDCFLFFSLFRSVSFMVNSVRLFYVSDIV